MLKQIAIRAGLDALYLTGVHRLLRPLFGGAGVIFALHRVCPPSVDSFRPNRHLEVTPDSLSRLVARLRARGVDIVSLDEVHRRLVERDVRRRFVALTFDDGYRDTLEHAYPVLRRHGVPFTVFVTTGFADRTADLWWRVLEAVVRKSPVIALEMDGATQVMPCGGAIAKAQVFDTLYWWLRTLDEPALRRVVRDLARRYGVDETGGVADLCMDWREIGALAEDPQVSIGVHTVTHPRLRTIPQKEARGELARSAEIIAAALGRQPEHVAYPVGDVTSAGPREFALARDLGFKTAVTMRRGVVFPAHAEHLHALPRVSLNGDYQAPRYAEVLRAGFPLALANRFRRLDVA